MKVKITPFGTEDVGLQVIEFNITLPNGARTDVAPQSSLTASTRYSVVYNAAETGAATYRQITKLNLVHTLLYTDCSGKQQVLVNQYSTIVDIPVTSNATIDINPFFVKTVDVLIPAGKSVVTQSTIEDTPTSLPRKANCSYSVFAMQAIPTPVTPA